MTKQISVVMERRAAKVFSPHELIVVRHARAETGGRLCGRTDVGLAGDVAGALRALADTMPDVPQVRVSPARRCHETLEAVWPAARPVEDYRLWEQDFGDWEGMPLADIPDAGAMDRGTLARFAAPGGESFADMYERVVPALQDAAAAARRGGPLVIVAHAGTARVALSLALGEVSAGLGFEIDPLSVTRLRCLPDGGFSIVAVNRRGA